MLAPTRVFGDIHGQLPDLLHLFHTYGIPDSQTGDIDLINYVFIGDFVDRGTYSLEVVATLFCLKLRYPRRVFLIRGNHEDSEVNQCFGFQAECISRLGSDGSVVWTEVNQVIFDFFVIVPSRTFRYLFELFLSFIPSFHLFIRQSTVYSNNGMRLYFYSCLFYRVCCFLR